MLTHFHTDHYSGYKEMVVSGVTNIFTDIYLPDIYTNKTLVTYTLLQLLIASKKSDAWLFAYYSIILLIDFSQLIQKKGKFHFVKKGASFTLGGQYDILAPEITMTFCFNKLLKDLLNPNTYNAISTLVEMINSIYSSIFRDCKSELSEQIVEASFVKNQENQLAQLLEACDHITLTEEEKKIIKGIVKKSKIDYNKSSIVFKSMDNRLLMTGDMTLSVWNTVVKTQIACKSIYIIKVPHHGTKAHFISDFPSPEVFLISNESYRSWNIDCRYVIKYDMTDFVCTQNTGCKYWLCHGHECPKPYCCGLAKANHVDIAY